jgi:uncharacterized damage-inducible protein DinB
MSHPEPWLRGTLTDVPAMQRAVLHALELAEEDIRRWCGDLSDEQLNAQPFGLPPIAFHIRHIARSIDRLLTYAEGRELSRAQMTALETELHSAASREWLFNEFNLALSSVAERVRAFSAASLNDVRHVGWKKLPTTVAGLLIHVADHTLRHVGQAITTAKIIVAAHREGDS